MNSPSIPQGVSQTYKSGKSDEAQLQAIKGNLDEALGMMKGKLSQTSFQGENLELMEKKAESITASAQSFKRSALTLTLEGTVKIIKEGMMDSSRIKPEEVKSALENFGMEAIWKHLKIGNEKIDRGLRSDFETLISIKGFQLAENSNESGGRISPKQE